MALFGENELVIATHNPGKAVEIADLLKPYVDKFFTASDLDLPEPEETGDTFAANAALKALASAQGSGKLSLADDSGLCVNALNGEPGIYSARWAGPGKDFSVAMEKVHQELGAAEDRSAYFICHLALAWPNGKVLGFEGRVDGDLVWPMRGGKGFGYDPMFVAKGYDITFGEMEPNHKHDISHRALAFEALIKAQEDSAQNVA